VRDPTRSQQQAVADEILAEIRALYAGLAEHGRGAMRRRLRQRRRAERVSGRAAAA
jgi:hypothetical protein